MQESCLPLENGNNMIGGFTENIYPITEQKAEARYLQSSILIRGKKDFISVNCKLNVLLKLLQITDLGF